MTPRLPLVGGLYRMFVALKGHIGDDYRADPEDESPGMCVTVGWSPDTGRWDYQTGDNSYTGGAYGHPHWAVVSLYRRSDSRALAREVRSQLADLVYL